jgi:hypothetical protein
MSCKKWEDLRRGFLVHQPHELRNTPSSKKHMCIKNPKSKLTIARVPAEHLMGKIQIPGC